MVEKINNKYTISSMNRVLIAQNVEQYNIVEDILFFLIKNTLYLYRSSIKHPIKTFNEEINHFSFFHNKESNHTFLFIKKSKTTLSHGELYLINSNNDIILIKNKVLHEELGTNFDLFSSMFLNVLITNSYDDKTV